MDLIITFKLQLLLINLTTLSYSKKEKEKLIAAKELHVYILISDSHHSLALPPQKRHKVSPNSIVYVLFKVL